MNEDDEMIDIWNTTVGIVSDIVKDDVRNDLHFILRHKFNMSLEKWKEFCLRVRNSHFLMGKVPFGEERKPFDITLRWAAMPQNVDKILSGKYDTEKIRRIEIGGSTSHPAFDKELFEEKHYSLADKIFRDKLLDLIGEKSFHTWCMDLHYLRFEEYRPEKFYGEVEAPHSFYAQQIKSLFWREVEEALRELVPQACGSSLFIVKGQQVSEDKS